MNSELHNVIHFYKNSDKSTIGFLVDDFTLTDNINYAKKFKSITNLEPIVRTLLTRVYKKDWTEYQGMSKHEYGHLYEDWFRGIDIKDVTYRVVNFEGELRRLKILNIKKS